MAGRHRNPHPEEKAGKGAWIFHIWNGAEGDSRVKKEKNNCGRLVRDEGMATRRRNATCRLHRRAQRGTDGRTDGERCRRRTARCVRTRARTYARAAVAVRVSPEGKHTPPVLSSSRPCLPLVCSVVGNSNSQGEIHELIDYETMISYINIRPVARASLVKPW